jgi:hypothetical protein
VIKSGKFRWEGHKVGIGGEETYTYVLVGKPEGKKSFGRVVSRWDVNIEIDL